MSWKPVITIAAVLAVVAGGIYSLLNASPGGGHSPGADSTGHRNLILHSGAGLRPVVSALTEAFERKHGIRVTANYAGGGQLVGQITAQCRGDLYMAGAERYADLIIEEGAADPETKDIVAYFVPVILVQNGNPKHIRALEDFTREDLRLGFGDERCCAIGGKTRKILEKNDIPFSEVQPNVVYQSKTVNELGMAVETGGVDAVVMWRKNATNFTDEGDIVSIPLEKNVVSPVPLVRLSCSDNPREAQRFIQFAGGPEGRRIWKDRGFTLSLDELKKTEP